MTEQEKMKNGYLWNDENQGAYSTLASQADMDAF